MNLYPMKNSVVIRPDPVTDTTSSGIFVAKKQTMPTGEVIRVGDKVTECNIGDRVVYVADTETAVTVDGAELLVVDVKQVIGTLSNTVDAINENIVCTDADFGDQVSEGGILIKSTMGKSEGITARWFRVYSVGSNVDWLEPEQWVLVEYGRWTNSFSYNDQEFWMVDPKSCVAVSDTKPTTISVNTDVESAEKKVRV